jgi:hypothetical protein
MCLVYFLIRLNLPSPDFSLVTAIKQEAKEPLLTAPPRILYSTEYYLNKNVHIFFQIYYNLSFQNHEVINAPASQVRASTMLLLTTN